MPKVKSATLGGQEHATVLLIPKRKKKKWVLTFYSVKNKGLNKQLGLINTKGLKDEPIFKLKFKSQAGIESMLTVLGVIRDRSIYEKGYLDAKKNNQLKGSLASLPIEQFAKLVKAVGEETDRRFEPKNTAEKKEEEKQSEAVVQQS